MTSKEIKNKIIKVLKSCKTEKQLSIGHHYCKMLNNFYNKKFSKQYNEINWLIITFKRK